MLGKKKRPRKRAGKKKKDKVQPVAVDQDLMNLGLWLYLDGQFFSWDHKSRFFKWFYATATSLLIQISILAYLVFELLSKQFAINSAFELMKEGKVEELAKISNNILDVATDLYAIDSGNQIVRVIQTILMTQISMLLYHNAIRAVRQKLELYLMLQQNQAYEGLSTASRTIWCSMLYLESVLKIANLVLICLICAQSASFVEALGNAFGIFILAEFSALSCNYVSRNVEVNRNDLATREDFMHFKIKTDYAQVTENVTDFAVWAFWMPVNHQLQWKRWDVLWLIGSSPLYIKLGFTICIGTFAIAPLVLPLALRFMRDDSNSSESS